uniref:Lectin-A (Fragments) n=1 Tax=Phytolacca americana TaxID=3527 RepID=LECA_PHYAM|nr:RecName: Full=Lectin-A; AltName: Full=PL-A [Phytolacca americana]
APECGREAHCGDDCQSQVVTRDFDDRTCPKLLCCSKDGWCGNTDANWRCGVDFGRTCPNDLCCS